MHSLRWLDGQSIAAGNLIHKSCSLLTIPNFLSSFQTLVTLLWCRQSTLAEYLWSLLLFLLLLETSFWSLGTFELSWQHCLHILRTHIAPFVCFLGMVSSLYVFICAFILSARGLWGDEGGGRVHHRKQDLSLWTPLGRRHTSRRTILARNEHHINLLVGHQARASNDQQ